MSSGNIGIGVADVSLVCIRIDMHSSSVATHAYSCAIHVNAGLNIWHSLTVVVCIHVDVCIGLVRVKAVVVGVSIHMHVRGYIGLDTWGYIVDFVTSRTINLSSH